MGFSKKTVAAICFGLLLLLIGGYLYWEKTSPVLEEQQKNLLQKISEQVSEISQSGNLAGCENIDFSSSDGVNYKQVCINNAILKLVSKNGDLNLCNKTSDDTKDDCKKIAISFLSYGSNCERLLGEDAIYCKNESFLRSALAGSDVNKCNLISDLNYKTQCKDVVFLNLLVSNYSSVSCSSFSNESFKLDCENLKKSILGGDLNYCSLINNQNIKLVCGLIKK